MRNYKYLVAVARHGYSGKAADECCVTRQSPCALQYAQSDNPASFRTADIPADLKCELASVLKSYA